MRTYLQLRNGTYYFRARIPNKYQSFFNGKCEFKQSMRQKSAKKMLILSNIIKNMLMELYMLLDHSDKLSAQQLVSDFLNNVKTEVDNHYYENKQTILTSFGKTDKYQLRNSISYFEQLHDSNTSDSNINFEVKELLSSKGLKLSSDSIQYKQIEQLFIEGKIELLEYMLSLISPKNQQPIIQAEATQTKLSGLKLTVEQLFNEFIEMKRAEGTDKPMTERGYREYTDAFNDFIFTIDCKDTLISELNQSHFKQFKDLLSKIPAHRTKKADTKNKNINELVKMDLDSTRSFSYETKRKKFSKIIAAFDYAVEHKYIQDNYAKAFKFPQKKIKKSRKQNATRVSIENKDLENMFNSPIYTTKAKLTKRTEPEKYFIFLCCLFSGARQNEICQLYTTDVRKENGIWYFNFNEEQDKKLKNDNAFRNVPIHNDLIKLGFLEYYAKVKESGSQRLWPNLKYNKRAQKYNIDFGKWFMTYFRKHVTKDPAKVFHSLRHTVTDKLEELTITDQVPHAAIAAILGHEDKTLNTTKENYHSGFKVELLGEVINKIQFHTNSLNKLL